MLEIRNYAREKRVKYFVLLHELLPENYTDDLLETFDLLSNAK